MSPELEDLFFALALQADTLADRTEPRYPLDTRMGEYRTK